MPDKTKKPRGRQAPPADAGANLERQIRKLERMHKQVAAEVLKADHDDTRIKTAAAAAHDQANTHLQEIEEKLHSGLLRDHPELARAYGELLRTRKLNAGVITHTRDRAWERGHQPPI